MSRELHRNWCAKFQWKGREPFYYGVVSVRVRGTMQEVEAEARKALAAGLLTHLPLNIEPPTLVDLIPGSMVFVPEEPE